MDKPPAVEILSVPVHRVTMAEAVAWLVEAMEEPRLHQVTTTNPEFVMAAQTNEAFGAVLRRADLSVPDGVGLLWAARRLGSPLAERVAGAELVHHLAAQAAARGWSLFLLGAAPGVAEEAAARLTQHYPGLQIAGTYGGSPAAAENDAIVARINATGARLLYVAFGAPRQDLWIDRNREVLTTVRVALGVGGALDFITGRSRRAPRWVQRLGLEWLHRLVREPWRWRRMLALPRFVVAVWHQSRRQS